MSPDTARRERLCELVEEHVSEHGECSADETAEGRDAFYGVERRVEPDR